MDLNLLPMFVAVAETQSFSIAARRLGVPKSTISRGVAALEASLEARLFHRSTRQVVLSSEGKALLERVANPLAALQHSVVDAPALDAQPSGTLRVTAANDVATTMLAEMISRFSQRYPTLQIDMRLSNAMVDIIGEGIDVALRISTKQLADSQLAAFNVGSVVLGVFASPNYLARRGTPKTEEELATHDWVMFRQTPVVRLDCPTGHVSVKAKGNVMCDDMLFAREMAAQGVGMAILPAYLAHDHVVAGRLTRVLPTHKVNSGNLWLVCPNGKHIPRKVVVFREFLMEQIKVVATHNQ